MTTELTRFVEIPVSTPEQLKGVYRRWQLVRNPQVKFTLFAGGVCYIVGPMIASFTEEEWAEVKAIEKMKDVMHG